MNALAYILVTGNVGNLLLWVLGCVVCFCIVLFIMRQLEAPAVAYKALYVLCAIVLLLLAIDAFFGGTAGPPVVVH